MRNKLKIYSKIFIILSVCALGTTLLPANAKFNAGISKNHFYDTQKTIMKEISPNIVPNTDNYWEKNTFFTNKYLPLFMLSNKDLISYLPPKKHKIINRMIIPSVYNVSFKTAPVTNVSLGGGKKNEVVSNQEFDVKWMMLYEQAKNKEADSDKKIETAVLLKDTKNVSNYNLAIDLLDDVTRQEPYNAYAYNLKGDIFFVKNDKENAMKNYVEALKLNPLSKQSCLGIAKILEPTNKELAQKYFEKAK